MAIDYAALAEDPCAAVRVLKPLLLEQIAEGAPKRIEFKDRVLEFHASDINNLKNLISELEDQCAEITGQPRRRRKFAITGGFRT